MPVQLGQLDRLDVRKVWESESQHFTPWLAENLELLAGALGLDEIELVDQETPVGAFSLDILAKEAGPGGRRIVIENQLEQTDHGHLGQLLLYAAGLEAEIAVWVSPRFRDEYRQTLEWLNAHTVAGISFFGVEVEVLQIGDSLPAVNFRVVAEPSEFQRSVASQSPKGVSDRQLAYHAFLSRVVERLNQLSPGFTRRKDAGYDSWVSFGSGRSGVGIHLGFARGPIFRVELYIDAGDKAVNKRAFDELQAESNAFEEQLGKLTWQRLDEKRACRIFLGREGSIEAGTDVLDELVEWGAKNLIRFREVFETRVRQLDLAPDEGPEDGGVTDE